jgi:hypothetical protein
LHLDRVIRVEQLFGFRAYLPRFDDGVGNDLTDLEAPLSDQSTFEHQTVDAIEQP